VGSAAAPTAALGVALGHGQRALLPHHQQQPRCWQQPPQPSSSSPLQRQPLVDQRRLLLGAGPCAAQRAALPRQEGAWRSQLIAPPPCSPSSQLQLLVSLLLLPQGLMRLLLGVGPCAVQRAALPRQVGVRPKLAPPPRSPSSLPRLLVSLLLPPQSLMQLRVAGPCAVQRAAAEM
jgi:hypothetical protein